MSILRPVFANPAVCKVFHGADSDILWLQRDFHIYVVNMFDTAKACLILRKPQRSLAYLLQIYCDVVTNKAFQRADWRLRPLPEDMVQYARTDAHYLLYIAHKLCAELKQSNLDTNKQESATDMDGLCFGYLLERVMYRSNLSCLQLYEKDGVSFSPTSTAASLLSRFYNNRGLSLPSQMDEKLMKLVTSLCEWRDGVARKEDESLRSVLTDTAIMALATSAPSTPELIYATIAAAEDMSQPLEGTIMPFFPSFESPLSAVEGYLIDLCSVIQRNNEGPLHNPLQRKLVVLKSNSKSYIDSLVEKVSSLFKVSQGTKKDDGCQTKDGPSVGMWDQKRPKKWRQGNTEKSRMQFVKKFSCKTPVYHNCRIYADDGRLLCFCDRKKLEWYVRRELAEFVQEEPPAVRLLFQPKGRPEDEGNDFYIQSKSNRCVGCGESSHYLRYRIIPSCYRQHFPEHLKSHRSHDIVLLCVDCHEVAHKAAEKHKRFIAEEYGVPLFAKVMDSERLVGGQKTAVVLNEGEGGVSPLQLKNAAMALLRHGPTIPTQRRGELEEVMRTYFGRDDISQQDLRAVLLLSTRPHGRHHLSKKFWFQGDCSSDTMVEEIHGHAIQSVSIETHGNPADNSLSLQGEDEKRHSSLAGAEQLVGKGSLVDLIQPAGGQKGHKNESVLGHGIHGRRVVEIVMKQKGDDGIRNFSQQWRRVFVEALQPAFLPLGWDVSHSGRREFGDFSVYKQAEMGSRSQEEATS